MSFIFLLIQKRNTIMWQYSSLSGKQGPRSAQPVLYQPKLLLPSPIALTSGHPGPHFCVEEKHGQRSGNESSLSNWCASSHQPPCEASESGEVRPVSLRKHMKEGCVCRAVKKREKGHWQLSRGWLAVKCSLFLALSPSYYLKTSYWGLLWKKEGAAKKMLLQLN